MKPNENLISCTVDQTIQRIKISIHFFQWVDFFMGQKESGMELWYDPTHHPITDLIKVLYVQNQSNKSAVCPEVLTHFI